VLQEANAAGPTYWLTPIPGLVQEGYSVNLILTVTGATTGLQYEFFLHVRDPSSTIRNSAVQDVTPISSTFQVILTYPVDFSGTNSLVGQYIAWVNQTKPISLSTAVASNSFYITLTDKLEYQRTETVSVRASGYSPAEPVTVTIRTFTTSTVVFSQTVSAPSSGIVSASWKIPKNATIDTYTASVAGTLTTKSPADLNGFNVKAAIMSIASLFSSSPSYERTQTMKFSFRPVYPSGENATTGAGIITLTRPDRRNVTLTASYDSVAQAFSASYKTFLDNQTGTWTASLPSHGYGDGYGNLSPGGTLTTSPQLQPATFSITITANSYFLVGQPVRFNATIQYPDGTNLRSAGQVFAALIYSGGGYNDSVSVVFDTNLQLWVGTYTPQVYEPGGLWSLTVKAWDSPSVPPPNSGSATKAVTLQDRPPTASFTKSSSTALTGAQITFNATTSSDIDGTISSYNWDFGDGSTGSGSIVTHSFSVAGTYAVKLNVTDNGGLTSQYTSAVTVQASSSSSSGNVSFPLYYFGVLATVIAALIIGLFLAFRRHKVTHARLKIDLEAVKAEAGRIENQEFFQSVKDQLKKDKE
jgi:hypothetical protein